MTPGEFLAWGLGKTEKQIGRMRISTLQKKWIEADLPPFDLCFTMNGKTETLYRFGYQEDIVGTKSKPKKATRSFVEDAAMEDYA